jgi:hypothetical protein
MAQNTHNRAGYRADFSKWQTGNDSSKGVISIHEILRVNRNTQKYTSEKVRGEVFSHVTDYG